MTRIIGIFVWIIIIGLVYLIVTKQLPAVVITAVIILCFWKLFKLLFLGRF